jgi:hypothetical protein
MSHSLLFSLPPSFPPSLPPSLPPSSLPPSLSLARSLRPTRRPSRRRLSTPHSRYHLPKKRTNVSSRTRHCRLPNSPKHPGTDAGEDPHHQMTPEITVEHAHKALLPPRDEADHDTPIAHRLIGAYRYDICMHLCPYAPRRRCRGVGRRQPLTDPSPGTIPRICSPFPALAEGCPRPFKFTQEPLYICFLQIHPRAIEYLVSLFYLLFSSRFIAT